MGWLWSLYFCQQVCLRISILAAQAFTALEAEGQVMCDRRPSPQCRPGKPILAAYVDNILAVCWDSADAQEFHKAVSTDMHALGFLFRSGCCDQDGCVFIGV